MWSGYEVNNATYLLNNESLGLFDRCFLNGTGCTAINGSTTVGNIEDIHWGTQKGAAASVILSVIFATVSIILSCCKLKVTTFIFGLLTTVTAVAAVGCWATFTKSYAEEVGYTQNYGVGFVMSAVSVVTSFFATVFACCLRKGDSDADYQYLA